MISRDRLKLITIAATAFATGSLVAVGVFAATSKSPRLRVRNVTVVESHPAGGAGWQPSSPERGAEGRAQRRGRRTVARQARTRRRALRRERRAAAGGLGAASPASAGAVEAPTTSLSGAEFEAGASHAEREVTSSGKPTSRPTASARSERELIALQRRAARQEGRQAQPAPASSLPLDRSISANARPRLCLARRDSPATAQVSRCRRMRRRQKRP